MTASPRSHRSFSALVTALGLVLIPAGLAVAQLGDRLAFSVPQLLSPSLDRSASEVVLGIVISGLGAVALAVAARTSSPRMSVRLPTPRLRWDPVAVVAAVVGAALTGFLWISLARGRQSPWSVAPFIASLGLFACAIRRLDRPARKGRPLSFPDLAVALACAAVSATFGSVGLNRWQFAWIGDELAFFFRAAAIARGETYNIFDLTDVYQAHSTLDSLYQAIVMRVLGIDVWAWRFGEVLAVAATAALIYLLGTVLFTRLVGVVAAVAVGSSHYLMAFERIAYNNLHALPVVTLAFLMVALAWRTRRAVFTWLAGYVVGLSLYTFAPATFVGPTLAIALGVPFLARPSRRQVMAGALMILAFGLVVAPALLVTPSSEITDLVQRQSRREAAAAEPLETFELAVVRSAAAFVANRSWRHHFVGSALVDPITLALAVVGLAGALVGLQQRAYWTMLVWLVGGLLLTAATSYLPEPHLTRLIYLLPPVALAAGVGGQILYRLLSTVLELPRWLSCASLVAIVTAIPLTNASLLHVVGPRNTHLPVEALAVRVLQENPDQTIVVASEVRDNNVAALLLSRRDFAGRFQVVGIDDLELPPPACGRNLQIPWLWTADPAIADSMQRRLGSTYAVQPMVEFQVGTVTRAWLFTPEDDRTNGESRVCFADATQELEIVVGHGPSTLPWDVATDSSGNVFVAVKGDNRIYEYSGNGRQLAVFGPTGSSKDRFGELGPVAIDHHDSLWALDSRDEAVVRLDSERRPLPVAIPPVGYVPRGLGLAPDGDLVIAITGAGEVRRYDPGGDLVDSIPGTGGGPPELVEPTDVVIAPDGEWFVLDAATHTIWRLTADRRPITRWQIPAGMSAASSGALAFHPSGHILVTQPTDLSHGDVAFYDLDGAMCGRWKIPGVSAPVGIEVDSGGRVLLTFPESGVVRSYIFGVARPH